MHKLPWKRLAFPEVTPTIKRRLDRAIKCGYWAYGSRARELERQIALKLDVPKEWVIATSSCTAALAAATYFSELETFRVPHMTYMSTYAWGYNARFHVTRQDCNDAGWSGGPLDVGVDLWGRRFDLVRSQDCAIIDAAHLFAHPDHARLAGEGVFVCYSFGPQKEIATPGAGALVSARVGELREEVLAWLNCGQSARGEYLVSAGGYKGLCPDTSAGVAIGQLGRQHLLKAARQRILKTYDVWLGSLLVTKPEQSSGHLAVLRFPDEGFCTGAKAALDRLRIEWSIHYRIHEDFADTNAYELSKRILTIPCHHRMTPLQATKIAKVILTV